MLRLTLTAWYIYIDTYITFYIYIILIHSCIMYIKHHGYGYGILNTMVQIVMKLGGHGHALSYNNLHVN